MSDLEKLKAALLQARVVNLGLLVHTDHVRPPIPTRQFDWAAWDDRTYDGPGCKVGTGPTEQAAIIDLLEQVEDDL